MPWAVIADTPFQNRFSRTARRRVYLQANRELSTNNAFASK